MVEIEQDVIVLHLQEQAGLDISKQRTRKGPALSQLRKQSEARPVETSGQLCLTIHLQPVDCCTPNVRGSQYRPSLFVNAEVILPPIEARIEKVDLLLGRLVEASKMTPLVDIARPTSKRQIRLLINSRVTGRMTCSTSNGKLNIASGAPQYSQRCAARRETSG